MNDLQIFKNEEVGEVRTIEIEGKPYFMASDVARALGWRTDVYYTKRKGNIQIDVVGMCMKKLIFALVSSLLINVPISEYAGKILERSSELERLHGK